MPRRRRTLLRIRLLIAVPLFALLAPFMASVPASAGSIPLNGVLTSLATLNVPPSVLAVSNDGQTIYVADAYAHEVLQVDVGTGTESVFAGDGTSGDTGNGASALSAELENPESLSVDQWNDVAIVDDGANVVRLVAGEACSSSCPYGLSSMTVGDIYTIAGSGAADNGTRPADGPATSTALELNSNSDQAGVDQFGDLFIPDIGSNADISMVAGESCPSVQLATCPYGFSLMTAGDIYWVAGNDFQGNPNSGNSGNGGPATSAEFETPVDYTVDANHDLLIGDNGTSEVRLVAAYDCSSSCPFGFSSLTAGDVYSLVDFAGVPTDLSIDPSGNLLIGDDLNLLVAVLAGSNCSSSCPYGLTSLTEGDVYTLEGFANSTSVNAHAARPLGSIAEPGGFKFEKTGKLLIGDEANDVVYQLSILVPRIGIPQKQIVVTPPFAPLRVTCANDVCRGVVQLEEKMAVKQKSGTKIELIHLASARYGIASGTSRLVKVVLTAEGKKLLANASKHHVRVIVTASVYGGSTYTGSIVVS